MSTVTAASAPPARRPAGTGSTLTGTAALLRVMLRRDRLRTGAWVLGIAAASFYFAHAVTVLAETTEDLRSLASLYADPVGRMMVGPGFGMDEPTYQRFYASGYALFIYVLTALFSIFTVIRHTRAEEQTGRAELVRANVVGRHATLTAALLLTLAANAVAAALVTLGGVSAGYDPAGSALVAASGFGVGVFFAGAAAVSAQLSESSRGASAMGGALLGLAYLIRMGGDGPEIGGTALSWFSPLGWSQQTAPFVHDRWWPLGLLIGCGLLLLWLGYWLSTKRDLESSLVHGRLGRAEAHPGLGTPQGLALRTLKGGLRGWGIALLLTGLMFGSYAQTLMDAADDLPPEMAQIFAGEDLMLGYLAYMGVFMAVFIAAAGVSGLGQLRGEENTGRAEYALSAPMGRSRWLGAHVGVLLAGLLLILVLVGLGMGAGAAASLNEDGGQYFAQLLITGILQAPAVLAVIGIVVALFGWLPRAALPVGWLVVGFSAVLTTFGSLLELPEFVTELNVFGHLAEYPVEDVQWAPMLWLSGIGVLGLVLGLIGWSRREVHTV
ncbi:exporter of polyketide antibiotics [Garicola koreensis]|uniref:ABC transporter permease n=1 Tax=Garicola koreensis TaxID=1262554 RepID=UPI0031E9C3A4